ncbi:MAG: hypothetical protein GY945_11040 [Rhodobacteraceae bacterium]|nr:hypothetical protein [Paracoccaceae bacterium]
MKLFTFLAASALLLLSACMEAPTSGGQNRMVTIGNYTGVTMTHFHASNTSRSDWEEDIFGNSVLRSGNTVNVNIDDGSGACMFDLRARFADGDVVIRNNFNVCRESSWVIS